MSAVIEQIQPDAFNKLASEAYFSTISLFMIREERFQSKINEALSEDTFDPGQSGKKPGVTIEVLMPMIRSRPDLINGPGPVVMVEQRFIVKENPQINLATGGVGLTAEEVCVQILQTFHLFQALGNSQAFYPAPECIVPNHDFEHLVAYDVVLMAVLDLEQIQQTGTPSLAENSPLQVTLTNAASDPDAAIYYTIDGSFPGPGNSTAIEYTEPFTVAADTLVRWAAYGIASGELGSICGSATITS